MNNYLPNELHVNNKDNFKEIQEKRIRNLLNEDVCIFLLTRENENEYYDLDKFCNLHLNRNMKQMQSLMENIVSDLIDNLGWKCKLSFNDTGLFIYSTENPPPSCW